MSLEYGGSCVTVRMCLSGEQSPKYCGIYNQTPVPKMSALDVQRKAFVIAMTQFAHSKEFEKITNESLHADVVLDVSLITILNMPG